MWWLLNLIIKNRKRIYLLVFLTVLKLSSYAQKNEFIDPEKVRPEIEALGKQFSEEFLNKDSVALANHYLPDAMIGSIKGHDKILSAWNRMIQNATAKDNPNLLFETTSIATDEENVVELGNMHWADVDGNVKSTGKYVVIWRLVDGEWKIYRDWGF